MLKKITLALLLFISLSAFAKKIPLTDKHIAYRGTLYPQISEDKMIPYRFPNNELFAKTFNERPTYSTKAGQSRTGVSILIKTDSPTVTLSVEYKNAQFAKFMVRQNKGDWEHFSVNGPDGVSFTIKSKTPNKVVEYCITGPASNPMYALTGLEIDDNSKLYMPSPKQTKTYVSLGDSISHGLRKDNTCQTWTWLTAEALNMEFYTALKNRKFFGLN